jgi:hypothetical protein
MTEISWKTRAEIIQSHLDTAPWDTFIQWATIQATMWVGDAWYIEEEYAALPNRWKGVLDMEQFGAHNLARYKTSGNLIHQAYHLSLWEEQTGQRVDTLESIVEVGGGYGAAARLCFARGFTGEYFAYDLAPLLTLQEYYVRKKHFIPCPSLVDLPPKPSALFSWYAFSELPPGLRNALLAQVNPAAFGFAYQNTYAEYNNREEMTKIILDHPLYQWQTLPAPGFVNHHYLFGCPHPILPTL